MTYHRKNLQLSYLICVRKRRAPPPPCGLEHCPHTDGDREGPQRMCGEEERKARVRDIVSISIKTG